MIDKAFSANYINADSNFRIFNLYDKKCENQYYPILCLVTNLLQRGCPSEMSDYLKTRNDYNDNEFKGKLHLLSNEVPKWGGVIKGSEELDAYPARRFYYSIIPEFFSEYPYLQQLLVPEVLITDIVPGLNKKFHGQQVDFFLGEAKLVIEIDGGQHKEKKQVILDGKRNERLNDAGYMTVRIPSECLNGNVAILNKYISQIKNRMNEYSEIFNEYNESFKHCQDRTINNKLKIVATMRLQIAILQMCMCGRLSLDSKIWNIAIKNNEVSGYEREAIEDLFLWIENICTMANIEFYRPTVSITQTSLLGEFNEEYIKIEMSLLKKGIIQNMTDKQIIYIYSDWRQDLDFFIMSTSKFIYYDIFDIESKDTGPDENTEINNYNEKRKSLRFILKNLYGFDEFRPGQERIIINALHGRDTIGVLPTGSGKSLCYQMAVLLQPCISLCVCPIKSLMIDQDQNLKDRKIDRTEYITSDLTTEQRKKILKNFRLGKYWFVFVSPERFQTTAFRENLLSMATEGGCNFSYAIIDEVHCLSEWGHDFRVSYLNLTKTIRKYCPEITLFGLTATASYNVLKNILVEFDMKNKDDVISTPSFSRPELKFEVRKINNKYKELGCILNGYLKHYSGLLKSQGDKSRCGIIFTPFVNGKSGCFDLCNSLVKEYRSDIRFYSGEEPKKWLGIGKGVFNDYKRNAQIDFKNNIFTLLTATKAFGMGIDKPNIRYTIHYGIPSSLEALYQEAGRAGRDRNKASCTILYTPEEPAIQYEVNNVLSLKGSIEDLQGLIEKHKRNGNDAIKQLFLFSNGLTPYDVEINQINEIIKRYAEPGKRKVIIQCDNTDINNSLQEKQKLIYHLSLVGVVEDWTVDWRSSSLEIDFYSYEEKSIFETTEKYIRNYEADYLLKNDPIYQNIIENNEIPAATKAVTIFWKWYYNNIIYSRKQALINVIEACNSYTKENAVEFKDRMESYFRLDDITDVLGTIADEPREYNEWFKVLNVERIRKEKIHNIIMGLNRFLESYQNNVGLNFISGLLNLIDNRFDSVNGKERLIVALKVINTFNDDERTYILQESAKIVYELGNDEMKEEFSEFFIRNVDWEDRDKHIYKVLNDNYSLDVYVKRVLLKMIKEIGEIHYGEY